MWDPYKIRENGWTREPLPPIWWNKYEDSLWYRKSKTMRIFSLSDDIDRNLHLKVQVMYLSARQLENNVICIHRKMNVVGAIKIVIKCHRKKIMSLKTLLWGTLSWITNGLKKKKSMRYELELSCETTYSKWRGGADLEGLKNGFLRVPSLHVVSYTPLADSKILNFLLRKGLTNVARGFVVEWTLQKSNWYLEKAYTLQDRIKFISYHFSINLYVSQERVIGIIESSLWGSLWSFGKCTSYAVNHIAGKGIYPDTVIKIQQ